MNFRLFQHIKQKHFILAILGICILAVVSNAVAFLFTDVIDDDPFIHSQISLNSEHFIRSHVIEKTHDLVIPTTSDIIHDRSPPLTV